MKNAEQLGQFADHDSYHSDINTRFGVLGFGFVVAHQSALLHEPAESSLDDPALGQYRKATLSLPALDHFHREFAPLGAHPSGELRPAVAAVAPQTAQPAKPAQRRAQ